MMLDPAVLAALQQALGGDPEWLEVGHRLERAARDGQPEPYRPFVYAFGYLLAERSHAERRERGDGPFGSAMSGDGWSFPPPLEDVDEADVAAWREAVGAMESPVARARLHDLLWERRSGPRPDLDARAAAEALLELVRLDHWHVMDRTTCASRALELANTINDAALRSRAVACVVALIERVLAAEEHGPGAALTLLRSLVDLREQHRPEALPALVRAADERFGEDPHLFDSIAELAARLGDPEEQHALRRRQVDRWRHAGARATGALRVFRLERALDVARTHGLNEEADEVRRELQNIRPEDLDLETISATMEIPTEEVKQWVDSIAGQANWQEALRHLGSEGPPGGTPDELEHQLAQEREEFVFLHLFTRTIMGHDTAASRFKAADDTARDRLEKAERRAFYARMWSPLLTRALREVEQRHGRPDHEALTEFFATDLIGERRAERIARAFELFWDDQPDESAHVLVPRLESTIREMARHLGLTIIREPIGAEPGGARALGTLMLELRDAFPDAGWHDYLFNVLANPLGLNLRNTIAHGLIDAVQPTDAALLLHAALFLRLLGLTPVNSD